MVRKVDLGCRIGALAILRSRISDEDDEDDFDKDDEVFEKKKKEGSKILATFKSEMADIVHMESDDVDEDYYGDDAPGERKKDEQELEKMQQKSKTSSSSSTATATADGDGENDPQKQSHHEEKVTTTSSSSISSPDDLEATKRSGSGGEGNTRTGKSAVKEERRRIEGDSTPIGDERFKKAEERLLANAGIFKHKYGESGRYADDEDNDDESLNDYLLFGVEGRVRENKNKSDDLAKIRRRQSVRGRFAQVESVRETANSAHGTFLEAFEVCNILCFILHHVVFADGSDIEFRSFIDSQRSVETWH